MCSYCRSVFWAPSGWHSGRLKACGCHCGVVMEGVLSSSDCSVVIRNALLLRGLNTGLYIVVHSRYPLPRSCSACTHTWTAYVRSSPPPSKLVKQSYFIPFVDSVCKYMFSYIFHTPCFIPSFHTTVSYLRFKGTLFIPYIDPHPYVEYRVAYETQNCFKST